MDFKKIVGRNKSKTVSIDIHIPPFADPTSYIEKINSYLDKNVDI